MYFAIKERSKFHNDFPQSNELFRLNWQNKFVVLDTFAFETFERKREMNQ
jgi:hypothetical protein